MRRLLKGVLVGMALATATGLIAQSGPIFSGPVNIQPASSTVGNGTVPTGVATGSVLVSNGIGLQGLWSASPSITALSISQGASVTGVKLTASGANDGLVVNGAGDWELDRAGASALRFVSSRTASANHIWPSVDATFDLGDPTNPLRWRSMYASSTISGAKYVSVSSVPTLTACGTGAITSVSTDFAGKITATGATACTVRFSVPYPTSAYCTIANMSVPGTGMIFDQQPSYFTITSLTAGNIIQYVCGGK